MNSIAFRLVPTFVEDGVSRMMFTVAVVSVWTGVRLLAAVVLAALTLSHLGKNKYSDRHST